MIETLIQQALAVQGRPLWTAQDVAEEIRAGRAQLWGGEKSVIIMTMTDYPNVSERVLEVWLAAGDLDEISAAIPKLEAWAREQNVTQVEINGRPGWARALRPHGFHAYTTIVRKFLT